MCIFQGSDPHQAHAGSLWGNLDLSSSRLAPPELYHGLAGTLKFLGCLTGRIKKTCRNIVVGSSCF